MDDTKINEGGVSLLALIMLVISSAIGAGIFDLTSTLATAATPGAALVAWLVTGIGVFSLAMSFKALGAAKPELTGVSDYARAGFGDFAGFISGWGYWLSAWLGNVAFATMLMSAIGYFVPSLKSGNSVLAIVIASLISWALTFLVTRGIEGAAKINTVVTIAKLIPLAAFIILGIIMFKMDVFTAHFWENFTTNLSQIHYAPATGTGIFDQVKGCLMSLMWVFVGIEGATMMAGRARKKSDAGKATVIGLLSLLAIYVVISMLPYGFLTQEQLMNIDHPALTYIVEDMIGPVGGAFVSIALIISVLGAWLSWTMLPVEATSLMASQGLLPKWFGKLNARRAPANSLYLTQVLVQLFLISLLFTDQAYNFAFSLCTAAIVVCYALVGAYQIKLAWERRSVKMFIPGFLALVFEVVGITFAGLQFLWLCTIAYVLGFAFYYRARKEAGKTVSKLEWLMITVITILAVGAVIALISGKIGV
ncbi:arginine-ornithine antiporter [Weissella halotolerans]|uniref:Arginine-ornithine antiporter n=1 Tax=Weissella halotolerans DSM 20190 TaxID=1123500 RepID=A0A0R2FTI7_9LACO|nr:arginine-ornithine antiporter [Weissella halotolerans]KRN30806.1 amino acid transporter [Weissella halotolerans DSM 20190]